MLFALFLMLLNVCVKLRRTIPRYIPFLTALVFPIVTYFYTAFVKGELFTNKISKASLYKFTTGREYILSLWKNKHYLSYGYGSSYDLIGRYLEMDLVEMYMEIGIIAVLAFALCYFAIVRKSFYAYLLMTYEFLGMLTSSSIPNPLSWTLVLLTIACFASDKQSDEETFTDNHRLSLRHHKSIVKAQ
ncbi:hypothetical protein OZX62_01915 [Bifidobacterium sp. ESL0690]|uniref:hypothetical protein n=1 Tax=Bifidobacterium sp. ESL0690 TaxID=2983214 RepID=UPI0023F647DF|nr:hypothetical protein [Bifidobacterium sp. ESL0690]WEV47074.1 hypothetical protein OZX62_01915 [Bifidobacterium sp. ESL0690]